MSESRTWITVRALKCPGCGALFEDMDDALLHVCKRTEKQGAR